MSLQITATIKQVSPTLTLLPSGYSIGVTNMSVSQTDETKFEAVLDIGTSEETLAFGDLTTPGYVFLRNLDSSNTVEYYEDASTEGFVLPASGGVALIYIKSGATIKIKANTATCQVFAAAYGV